METFNPSKDTHCSLGDFKGSTKPFESLIFNRFRVKASLTLKLSVETFREKNNDWQ